MLAELQLINLNAIQDAVVAFDPYTFFLVPHFLKPKAIPELSRDFPDIKKPGFVTVDDVKLKGSFEELIVELEGAAMADAVSSKLGINLQPFPRLTTVRKFSQLKDGRIHTDSQSKLATLLVYMNDSWEQSEAGRLRVLRDGENFDNVVVEIPPTMGSAFGFRRADNSWHGHKPFAGERRVVQVTWLTDAEELNRKKRRNSLSKFLKGIFRR